jgi:hypothetical protein
MRYGAPAPDEACPPCPFCGAKHMKHRVIGEGKSVYFWVNYEWQPDSFYCPCLKGKYGMIDGKFYGYDARLIRKV